MSRSRLAGQTRDKAVTAGASARDKLVQLTKFGSKRVDRDTEKEDLAEDSAPSDHVPVEEVITQVTNRDQASLDFVHTTPAGWSLAAIPPPSALGDAQGMPWWHQFAAGW